MGVRNRMLKSIKELEGLVHQGDDFVPGSLSPDQLCLVFRFVASFLAKREKRRLLGEDEGTVR